MCFAASCLQRHVTKPVNLIWRHQHITGLGCARSSSSLDHARPPSVLCRESLQMTWAEPNQEQQWNKYRDVLIKVLRTKRTNRGRHHLTWTSKQNMFWPAANMEICAPGTGPNFRSRRASHTSQQSCASILSQT